MKSIYKIVGVVVLIVLIGIGIYLGWRKISEPGTANNGSQNNPNGSTSGTNSPGVNLLEKLSDNSVFSYWIYQNVIYYFDLDGKVFEVLDGPDREISGDTLSALNFIKVSPNKNRVLVAFGDPGNPSWGIFDSGDKVWRPLDTNILNAVWGTNDETIYAVIKNNNFQNLSEINISKNPFSSKVLVRDFRFKDVQLLWRPPQFLLLLERSSALYPGRLWQLDTKNLNLNLLLSPQNGLMVNLSHDQKLFFISNSLRQFMTLDLDLKPVVAENSFITFSTKCAGAIPVIYCFEPQEIPVGVSLPDDYLMGEFFTIDDVFSLNTENKELKKILSSNNGSFPAIDARDVNVLSDKLYFVNRYDNKLYRINIE